MRAHSFILIGLLFILFSFGEEQKDSSVPLSKEYGEISQSLNEYFTALTNLKKFNGVVLAYKSDTLLLEKAYNIYPSADSSTYVDVNSQIDIHSISKLMSFYLVAKLDADGVLNLDDSLAKFYPNFPNGDEITIDMLLHHRSGLPRELMDFDGNEYDLSQNEIVAEIAKQGLLFEPGSDVQYSNLGYELIYDIVGDAYGKPFAQVVVDEIFIPLAMDHSGAYFFSNTDRLTKPAQNHVLKDSILTPVPNILEDEFKTARIYSTVDDLDLFLQAVEKEPYRSMLMDEEGLIEKSGGSKGVRAQVYSDFESDFRFVFLSNYDEMPFTQTIDDMVKILKSESFEIPKPINRKAIDIDSEILKNYVGSYVFADFDGLVLRVAVEEEHLVLLEGDKRIADLKAESETVFFEDPKAAESFEFVPNDRGSFDAVMGWKGIETKGERLED